jgi:sucrose phosphorylase
LYQVNCTFYDALGRDDNQYLIARAIQFFVPGIPQVYYVGLFAGTNDMELLSRSRVGRDINRHYYTAAEIETSLQKPVVRKLLDLIRLRNTHPAFAGQAQVETPTAETLSISWENCGHWAKLDVDLREPRALVTHSKAAAANHDVRTWDSQVSVMASEAVR